VDGTPGTVDKGAEIRPVPQTNEEANATGQGKIIPAGEFRGAVEFKKVKFSYPQREAAILGGLDLVVNPGETVALIGQSGSGRGRCTG
jgi:ABC-type bacteriocin/lantibiotic exporter with double-glycine peptidase domain